MSPERQHILKVAAQLPVIVVATVRSRRVSLEAMPDGRVRLTDPFNSKAVAYGTLEDMAEGYVPHFLEMCKRLGRPYGLPFKA